MHKVTMLALALLVGAAQAAMADSKASAASKELIRQVEDLLILAAPGELKTIESSSAKAVSRKNIADANMTAPVAEIGELMFLPEGPAFRVVVLQYPTQIVPIICRGDALATACGKLRVGQRISTVNDIATFQEGFYHNLSLFYVRKLIAK
jgi:hypothetical protein